MTTYKKLLRCRLLHVNVANDLTSLFNIFKSIGPPTGDVRWVRHKNKVTRPTSPSSPKLGQPQDPGLPLGLQSDSPRKNAVTPYQSWRLPPTHVCKTLMSAIFSTGVARGFFSNTTKSASLTTSKLPILSSDFNWYAASIVTARDALSDVLQWALRGNRRIAVISEAYALPLEWSRGVNTLRTSGAQNMIIKGLPPIVNMANHKDRHHA